jgi:predicted outer membrane repeat protein
MSSLKGFKSVVLFVINKRAIVVIFVFAAAALFAAPANAADIADFAAFDAAWTSGTDQQLNLTGDMNFTKSYTAANAQSFANNYEITGYGRVLDGQGTYSGIRGKNGGDGERSIVIGEGLTFQNFYVGSAIQIQGVSYNFVYMPATLTIGDGATFKNNDAKANSGGAIDFGYVGADKLNIGNNAMFDNNTAASGGAVFSNTATEIGNDATFQNNTATSNGGAIWSSARNLSIGDDALFDNNTAAGNGGAISAYVQRSGETEDALLSIGQNAEFSANKANGYYGGGAIGVVEVSDHAVSDIQIGGGAVFSANQATVAGSGFGGAISNYVYDYFNGGTAGGRINIEGGAVFSGNTAAAYGGAISNYVIGTNAGYTPTAEIVIGDGTTFSGNSASLGGAIFNLVYNTASATGGVATIQIGNDVLFEGNHASAYGGAIYISGGESSAINITTTGGTTKFYDNTDYFGKNDIYLGGNNAALNIDGSSGKTIFESGISNQNATAVIAKSNGGILTFGKDAINANFTGTFNQTGGTTNVYGQFFNNALNNVVSNSTLNFYREGSASYGTIGKLSLSDSQFNIISEAGAAVGVAVNELTISGEVSFNLKGRTNEVIDAVNLNAANAAVNFLLPDTTVNNDKILSVSGSADITSTDVKVGITGSKKALNNGERILLIDAGTLSGQPVETESTAIQGLTLVYDFGLSVSNNQLWATVLGSGLNPQTKAFSEGRAASIAGISQMSDLVARTGIESAVKSAQEKSGATLFSGFEGGFTRYNTGSHIDLKNTSLIAGVAKTEEVQNLRDAQLTYGGFIEFGANWYDTYNDAVRGRGNNQYYGLGFLSRLALSENYYVEISLRGGTTRGNFSSGDMGQPASYDTDAPYWGGHMGIGYITELAESLKLNSYMKYLYAAQNGEKAELPTGEEINFKRADSGKMVLGGRVSANAFYGGLAYEYEFSGAIDAEIAAMAVESPSLRGGSVMTEAGYGEDFGIWKFDAGLQGYLGKRKGIGGGVKIGYRF